MKLTFKLLSLSFLFALIFTSCTDEDVLLKTEETAFDKEGAIINVTNLAPGFFDLANLDNASVGFTLSTAGTDVNNADIFVSRNGGDYVLLKNVSSFPSDETVTLDQVVDLFGITKADVAVGEKYTMKFVSNASDGVWETGKKFDVLATCQSTLAGTYEYLSENYWCGGESVTGSVDLTESDPGVFTFSDWAFGTYVSCYGSGTGGGGSLVLKDVCDQLSLEGEDAFGDTWTISDVTVNGDKFSFLWSNTYGESGMVTLTNADGDWPPLYM